MTESTNRDPVADLYAVATALADMADTMDEEATGTSCLLRLLGQEVRSCAERLDVSERKN